MKARTRAGRLAAVDLFVLLREPLRRASAFIDLGFGETPVTTLESADALPVDQVIGVEADLRRATAAARLERPGVRFVHGDFDVLPFLPRASVLRVMNVLRSHREDEVPAIHALLGKSLADGGLLIEGSCDPDGAILTAHLIRRRGEAVVHEGVLFFSDCSNGFAPMQFRDWLPRDLRRSVRDGEPVFSFLSDWTAAWERVRSADPLASFAASAAELGRLRADVDASLAPNGFLIWTATCAPICATVRGGSSEGTR